MCAEFGCLIINYSIRSHMLKSDMTRKASCKRPESRHTRPPALRFHPLGGAKWPNVQLRYCFWLTRSTAVLNRFHTQCYHLVCSKSISLYNYAGPASTFLCVPGPCGVKQKRSNFKELGSELHIKQVGSVHVLEDLNGAKGVGSINGCP